MCETRVVRASTEQSVGIVIWYIRKKMTEGDCSHVTAALHTILIDFLITDIR
jgi:hypothetical protein